MTTPPPSLRCPTCRRTRQITGQTYPDAVSADLDLDCSHTVTVLTAWCGQCRGQRPVVEVDSDAVGTPAPSGLASVYRVTYLVCGHTVTADTGDLTRVV